MGAVFYLFRELTVSGGALPPETLANSGDQIALGITCFGRLGTFGLFPEKYQEREIAKSEEHEAEKIGTRYRVIHLGFPGAHKTA